MQDFLFCFSLPPSSRESPECIAVVIDDNSIDKSLVILVCKFLAYQNIWKKCETEVGSLACQFSELFDRIFELWNSGF